MRRSTYNGEWIPDGWTDSRESVSRQSVTVSTDMFVAHHGRQPRGSGCWGFLVGSDPDVIFAYGTYAKCKGDAMKLAVAKGETYVEVCP